MTEFIGSRISLISKRDIRYVGILHEISSENSTVALERVVSYGTEGRRPDDEVPPSLDNIYEYIVFRGSDVKDLRIEEGPKDIQPPASKVPDDPAILGTQSGRKPSPVPQPGQGPLPQVQQPQAPGGGPPGPAPHQQQPHPVAFAQQNYQYGFNPNHRFGGPQGFPPGPYPFPPPPYGAPPGWYPPQGYPQMPPGQFPPHQMPIGAPGQRGPILPNQAVGVLTSSGSAATPKDHSQLPKPEEKQGVSAGAKGTGSTNPPIPLQEAPSGPSPGMINPESQAETAQAQVKEPTSGPKGNKIVPAIPLSSQGPKTGKVANGPIKEARNATQQSAPRPSNVSAGNSVEDGNRDARAAVAAAMAKLPAAQSHKAPGDEGAMDSLSKKVGELRATDQHRNPRQAGASPYAVGGRGGRGGRGGARSQMQKVEIPQTDYDFESANAKFNKQDLVKEAIAAGSPIGTPGNDNADVIPDAEVENLSRTPRKNSEAGLVASYNKSTSFFDDISSEIKDRAETHEAGQRLTGREFRHEERQKNMETFGQGSVDNGYRYRGRGRGRGRAGYGRGRGGGGGRGRGRGAATAAATDA